MLTIEPPYYVVRGITIFRDHEDPDLHYYLPGRPALATSGDRLAFSLYKYRRDLTDNPALDPTRALGAGVAMFEVEIPPPRLGPLTAELASLAQRPNARLVPVMFTSASARALVAHGEGEGMIDDLVEVHGAPLVAPHHATFALALTAEGATLVEQAARGGALPVGVVYEMRFLALTPSLRARVRMRYDRIYERFAASLGFTYYVNARIDADIAKLEQDDLVHIDITEFSDDEDRERRRRIVMELVTERIRGDFFRSGLPSEQEGAADGLLAQAVGNAIGGKVSSSSALFVLKARYDLAVEEKEFELAFDGRTALALTHTASAHLATMTRDGGELDIRSIDLDDPFFSSLEVRVESIVDFSALDDLQSAIVHLSFHDHRASHVFSRTETGPFVFRAAITDPTDDEYTLEAEYTFDADAGSGPLVLRSAPRRLRKRVAIVDPFADFRYRRVRFALGPLDFARVPRVRVHVRVPGDEGGDDLAAETFFLDAPTPERTFRLRLPLGGPAIRVLVRTEWEDASGEVHPGDTAEVVGDAYVVRGPYRDVMALQIYPLADWAKVTSMIVEIVHEEGNLVFAREIEFTKERSALQRLEIPLIDPRRRRYRFRRTVFSSDGTRDEAGWSETDEAVLVISSELVTRREVRVIWVGPPGDAFGLRIDLFTEAGDDPAASVFLRTGAEAEKTVSLPLDSEGKLAYRYEVRKVSAAGEDLLRSGEGNSTLLVVQAS